MPGVLAGDIGSIIAIAISIAIVQTRDLLIIQLKNEYQDEMFFCFSAGRAERGQERLECEIPELKFNRKNSTCLEVRTAREHGKLCVYPLCKSLIAGVDLCTVIKAESRAP